jgi:metal-responsive CopG/Arc/MetJ family transcriptional regulator
MQEREQGNPKSKEKMQQITISIPPWMLKELKERTAQTSDPMEYLIRQAIADYFQNHPRLVGHKTLDEDKK